MCVGQYEVSQGFGPFIFIESFYFDSQVAPNPPFQVAVSSTPSSVGFCTAQGTAQVSGAVGPLTYFWDGVSGTSIESGLCPGIHSLKVIDANLDSVNAVFGIADSLNYFSNNSSSAAADSIFVLYENCSFNYTIPTDSITIDSIQYFSPDTLTITFTFWQGGGGTTMTDNAYMNLTSAPAWYFDITLFCYTKMINSNVVKHVRTMDKQNAGLTYSEKETISFYPNPASDVVYFTGIYSDEIRLYDLNGKLISRQQVVQQGGNGEFDVSALPRGIYFCRDNDGREGKLIKN